ncbi:MAG: LCP family protein [Clostridia bacterium]|nr:LCP family protein [Clostridia bacterium]
MDNLRRAILLFTVFMFLSITVIGFVLSLDYYKTASAMEAVPAWNYNGEQISVENKNETEFVKENILVIIGDEGVENSEIMFVSQYDAELNTMSFIYIPKDMKYYLNVDTLKKIMSENSDDGESAVKSYNKTYNLGTMSQLYSRFEGEVTSDIVSYMLNIPIDSYVFFSFNDCCNLFNGFIGADKGLLFNFPVYASNVEMGISINSGEQFFDGKSAVELMRFYKTSDNEYSSYMMQYYDGTDIKRIEMVKQFTKTFLESQLLGDSVNSYYIDNFYDLAYERVIKSCKTNIRSSFVQSVQSTIRNIKPESVSFYILGYKTADNNAFLYEYTNSLKDITND